ncbi:MAG: hypothetical protein K1060chlam2_00621 [Chlamydiae bacterium]|nr:hypothetical protein [Chlamydiota bacterium]
MAAVTNPKNDPDYSEGIGVRASSPSSEDEIDELIQEILNDPDTHSELEDLNSPRTLHRASSLNEKVAIRMPTRERASSLNVTDRFRRPATPPAVGVAGDEHGIEGASSGGSFLTSKKVGALILGSLAIIGMIGAYGYFSGSFKRAPELFARVFKRGGERL